MRDTRDESEADEWETTTRVAIRSRNTVGSRIRRAQELHLHPRPADRGYPAQSCQGAEVMGVEHW